METQLQLIGLKINHLDDEVVDDEVEDDEATQVILVKTYLIMLLPTIIQHLNLILIILIVRILIKYVHSNVIMDTHGIQQIVNVRKSKRKLTHETSIHEV